MHVKASYNCDFWENPSKFTKLVADAVAALRPVADCFQSIAFRGTSGAMFGPAIAAALGKGCTLVRKDDGHHEENGPITGSIDMDAYMIIDDLIATGETVRVIQRLLRQYSPCSKCAGIYLWRDNEITLASATNTYNSRFILTFQNED